MPKEIKTIDDIRLLVDAFYTRVRADSLLGNIFNEVIQDRWPVHLEKMYRFWQTVLLEEHTYNGTPFLPHALLPVEETHFNRWIELFNRTVDEHFEGEKATEAKWRGSKMAEMFLHKIRHHRKNPGAILK